MKPVTFGANLYIKEIVVIPRDGGEQRTLDMAPEDWKHISPEVFQAVDTVERRDHENDAISSHGIEHNDGLLLFNEEDKTGFNTRINLAIEKETEALDKMSAVTGWIHEAKEATFKELQTYTKYGRLGLTKESMQQTLDSTKSKLTEEQKKNWPLLIKQENGINQTINRLLAYYQSFPEYQAAEKEYEDADNLKGQIWNHMKETADPVRMIVEEEDLDGETDYERRFSIQSFGDNDGEYIFKEFEPLSQA